MRRFTDEVNRRYGVLNNALYGKRYMIGDEHTSADMICYPWTVNCQAQGQDLDEFPYFKRWFTEFGARPAPIGRRIRRSSRRRSARLRKVLYNQRARPAPPGGLLEV